MGTISRRSYFGSTAAVLCGLLAAACDPFGSSRVAGESGRLAGPAPEQPARRKGPLAIRVLYGPWQGPLFTAVTSYVLNAAGQRITPQEELYRSTAFAAFRDRYPDSSVELGVVNDPLLVAEATHAAGEAPDIFQLDDRRGTDMIRRGAVARLDGRVRQWSGHADLVRPAWEAGRAGRHQWGLPLCTFVYTCYFDAAVLQEVGIARLPETWEQLLAVADRSTVVVRGQRLARQGMTTPDSQWFWWLLQSMGATLYEYGKARLADGEAETALRFLRDLHRAVQPPGVTPLPKPRGFVPDGLESVRLWEAGQVAHAWASRLPPRSAESARQHRSQVLARLLPQAPPTAGQPRSIPTVPAEASPFPSPDRYVVGTPPVPDKLYTLPGGRQVPPLVHTHSAVLHLSARSAHPDEAWELLTMLLEPDTLYKFNTLRQSLPPRQSILGRGYLQDRKMQQIIALWLRYGRPPFNPPDYRAVARAINELFLEVVRRGRDPRRTVREFAGWLDEIAARADPPYAGTTR